MDCYIVRVYRHITRKNGQDDEIAGLVEHVGEQDTGKPFTSYKGMVDAIRDSIATDCTAIKPDECTENPGLSIVKAGRGR